MAGPQCGAEDGGAQGRPREPRPARAEPDSARAPPSCSLSVLRTSIVTTIMVHHLMVRYALYTMVHHFMVSYIDWCTFLQQVPRRPLRETRASAGQPSSRSSACRKQTRSPRTSGAGALRGARAAEEEILRNTGQYQKTYPQHSENAE